MFGFEISKLDETKVRSSGFPAVTELQTSLEGQLESPLSKVAIREPDIFELARNISYKANGRRRFRRSISIL